MTKHKLKIKTILEKKTYVFFTPITRYQCECWCCWLGANVFILARGDGRAGPTSSSKSTLYYYFVFGTSIPLPSSRCWHSPGEDTAITPNPAPSLRFTDLNQEMDQVTLTRKTLKKSQFFLKLFWCQLQKKEGGLHQIRETFQLRNSKA